MSDPQPQVPGVTPDPVQTEATPEVQPVEALLAPGADPEQETPDVEPVDEAEQQAVEAEQSASRARNPEGNQYGTANPSAPTADDAGERRGYNPPLKKGDRTAYVRKAQTYLRNFGGVGNVDVNGIFDSGMELKVKELQKKHNLEQSGEVDDATWDLLRQLKADA